MANQIRPADAMTLERLYRVERLISEAIEQAVEADAPRLAEKLRRARASCGGAIRHARHRISRTEG